MTLRLFDTLSRRKKVFRAKGKSINIFLCGPTVYDHCHLGHARFFATFDMIARYLRFRGYRTKVVMNVTDVSSEIFENAERDGQTPEEYSTKYFRSMLADLEALGIETISKVARASDNVPDMMEWIKRLLERGAAYVTEEGVFMDTSKVKGYGSLSHQSRGELALRRLDLSPAKRNPEDFLLWVCTEAEPHAWNSPWGRGRPGQHIEDAAACFKHLGTSYDINGGGDELVFPHHEATKAQIEAVTGKPMCRYWLHTGLLRVGGRKMSKSAGNFISIQEALGRYHASSLRLYFSLTHYRKQLDFRRPDLERAFRMSRSFHGSVEKIRRTVARVGKNGRDIGLDRAIKRCERRFIEAMDDDLHAERAVRQLIDLAGVAASSRHLEAGDSASAALSTLTKLSRVLGIM
jgi:cysteinyl-tRNA synthetase